MARASRLATDGQIQPPPAPCIPFLRIGFRPFYLLAAGFAAIAIPLWLGRYLAGFSAPAQVDLYWHAHEMVFGFATAVIMGFLYTAGRNWTGLWTPRGHRLALIAGLWLLGRLAMLFADPRLAAAVDLGFLPVAAWPLYQVLRRAQNRRNLGLLVILALLWVADLGFHASRLGWLPYSPLQATEAAILLIVMLMSIIGGRVIPPFTTNAIGQPRATIDPRLDRGVMVATAAILVVWSLPLPGWLVLLVAVVAAALHLRRLGGWQSRHVVGRPLLWILHLAYAWIPLGLLLLGLSAVDVVTRSAAFHALTVGAMAGLIVGMITRTALGHTGRPLEAGLAETCMYTLIALAAIARVAAALLPAAYYPVALVISMVCWVSAFLTYIVVYGPYLWRARLDGAEG